MQVSFLLAPSLLSLFSNIKHDQYARPQMLKITCKTSLAKLGVGVVGLVSRVMADQLMKSVCNQRNKEFSTNLPGLQGEGWIVKNLELDQVLRAQPIIMNIIKGTTRRDGQDKTARFGF